MSLQQAQTGVNVVFVVITIFIWDEKHFNGNNLGNLFGLCNVFIVSMHAHVLSTIDSFHPIYRKRC